MIVCAIETSCDETSVAIVRDGEVLSNLISSQIRLHAEYGGVVPELAAREHLKNLLPVARACLRQAGVNAGDLDAVAATRGPGLPGALVVGFRAGQALAFALGKPFFSVHHHEAHLYSPWIQGDPPRADFDALPPNVSLIVSGGHTMLVHVLDDARHRVLGSTVDDAAGECFDKTAKLIGLPYPGGPEMDRLATEGNPRAHEFPRPMLREAGDNFSFSGLKTAVLYYLRDHPEARENRASVCDLCASIQSAIVDVLVAKTRRAARRLGVECVTASGGVSRNSGLRTALARGCREDGLTLRLAQPEFCTDNAAMIAMVAERRIVRREPADPFDEDIKPSWVMPERDLEGRFL